MASHIGLFFEKDTEQYGLFCAKGTSRLALELQCYREDRKAEQGGLGAERHFRNAFRLSWPGFIWHDWMEMLMTAWCRENYITVIGHSRATKTYGAAHLFYLDYCANPYETWTSLTTTTFPGLQARMWSDLMAAIETATFACPFKVTSNSNSMMVRIGDKASKKDDKFMIEGFATAENGAGRIQGKHANRRRLGLDEAQELPDAIWTAEVNAGTAPDFKTVRLANPVDKQSRFGRECCEPKDGWGSIRDTDLSWRAKNDRLVLHFDGLQCFNYKLWISLNSGRINREEYDKRRLPFMLSAEYIEQVRVSPGEDSLEWWMYVRGFFPTDGLVAKVFPDAFIARLKCSLEYDFPPVKFSVLDPAYEHDNCVLHHGEYGKMRNGKIGAMFRKTECIEIKLTESEETKDEQIAQAVKERCVAWGTAPENYAQDKSGNGRSVYSNLSRIWSRRIIGVEFGGKPTDRTLIADDPTKCEDLFEYFIDELHFRAAAWAQSGQMGGLQHLDGRTEEDLASRRYVVQKRKRRVEKKAEVKKRLGRSPDFGDSFILAAELLEQKGHRPDGSVAALPGNDLMEAQRRRALNACKRYNREPDFAH